MLRAIEIRIYPNIEQQKLLNSLFGCYRFVYNQCLNYKKSSYEFDKTNINRSDLGHFFHQDLRNNNEWLKDQNTKVLKQAIINMLSAYNNFFVQHKGFPKFKVKQSDQSARFPKEAISVNTFDESNCRLNLTTTIKDLKFECSKRDKKHLFKNKDLIKSITLSKTTINKYFAAILIDSELDQTMSDPTNNIVGIDLGIKTFVAFSDGQTVESQKWIRINERWLKKLQRDLSRKKKGSNNWKKAKLKLALAHEKIRNQKQDFLHNLSYKIISENQTIVLEDLSVTGMLKNHQLAKCISELSLFEFRRQLEYKAKWHGREVIIIDQYFPSSKLCSKCGWKNDNLTLNDRVFICPECGLSLDRDLNAAINIKNEGIRIIGQRLPEFKLVDDLSKEEILCGGRLKQEENLKFS